MLSLGRRSCATASFAPRFSSQSRLGQMSTDPRSCQNWPGPLRHPRPTAGRDQGVGATAARVGGRRTGGEEPKWSNTPGEAVPPPGAAGPSRTACCHLVGRVPRCPAEGAGGGAGAALWPCPAACPQCPSGLTAGLLPGRPGPSGPCPQAQP